MAIKDGTKVVTGFFNTMKTEPLSLALVVMNLALIGFVYFQSTQFNSQRVDNVRLFIDVQKEVQKLLSQCIVPAPQQYYPPTIPIPRPRPKDADD